VTFDLGDEVTMKLVLIPAGKFMMGSPKDENDRSFDEGPQHEVTLTKPFYMGIYSVTQPQWKAVMRTEPWKGREFVKEGATFPATCIGWDDATEFCKTLSGAAGKMVRLPTEAEREHSTRAGTKTRFYYGDDPDFAKLSDYTWWAGNAWAVGEKYAHPVGQKKPNDWGLYDMHGNIYEWCSDRYGDSYAKAEDTDPQGPATSPSFLLRVLRGGSCFDNRGACRSARRFFADPDRSFNSFGFRVVMDVK
jgi:formylglycine-generating enzyme required for sulfatase activity